LPAPDSAIGFVEAHGLALILGVIMLLAQPSRFDLAELGREHPLEPGTSKLEPRQPALLSQRC
jgi:hypothetical protein